MNFRAIFLCFITLIHGSHLAVKFTFQPFTMNTLETRKLYPKMEPLEKIIVEPLNANVEPNFKLLEFVLLDLSFEICARL